MNHQQILLCWTFLIALSCAEKETAETTYKAISPSDFAEEVTLKLEPLQTNAIMDVRDFMIKDDHLIVLNRRDDSLFMAFQLDPVKLVASWGRKGRGPGEYELFSHLVDLPGNRFYIADYSLLRIHEISLPDFTEIAETPIINNRADPVSMEIPQSLYAMDDSTFVYDRSELHALQLAKWTFNQSSELLYDFPDLKPEFPDKNMMDLAGDMAVSPSNNALVYAHRWLNRFDIVDLNGKLVKAISKEPKLKGLVRKGEDFDYENSILGYPQVEVTEDAIFLYYLGYAASKAQDLSQDKVTYIEEFDWKGNPKVRYKINDQISEFKVWEQENGEVYFIAMKRTEEEPFVLMK